MSDFFALLFEKELYSFSFCRQKENGIKRKSAKPFLRPFGGKRQSRALSSEAACLILKTSSCGMFSRIYYFEKVFEYLFERTWSAVRFE